MATINRVVRFALSDAGVTAADGVNVTDAEVRAKREAGYQGLLVRGSERVSGICHDYSGNMYITDTKEHCILRVDEGGKISLFAGLPGTSGDVLGANQSARFNAPAGICCDKSGNIYVADSENNKIKVIAGGRVSLVAGSTEGLQDGVGSAAKFKDPWDVAIDKSGVLYVADKGNHAIRKVTDGNVLTIAGNGSSGNAQNVEANGQTASFNTPTGVAVDLEGNVYVLDSGNYQIKKIVPRGWIYLLSGSGAPGIGLGTAFNEPYTCSYTSLKAIDADESGNLYVLDDGSISVAARLVKVDYRGKPGVIVNFATSSESNRVAEGVACTPGQKILVTFASLDPQIESASSASSESSESSSSSSSEPAP